MKKKKKKSHPKRGFFEKLTVIYIGLALLLLLPGFFAWKTFTQSRAVCANSISCISDLSGKFDPNAKDGIFMGQSIAVPKTLATLPAPPVLGATTGKKRIEVDLSTQHLYAYEDSTLVYSFPVSTGKWHKTPTGTFSIWIKLKATRMTGGEGADFYDLPNVPYVMFFYNNDVPKSMGFSIHGAYWHNNFGYPMSHGCVNMRIEDVAKLYQWADPPTTSNTTYATKEDPGTEVIIYGTTPS